MCSFIKVTGEVTSLKKHLSKIKSILDVKGGDEYGINIHYKNYVTRINSIMSLEGLEHQFERETKSLKYNDRITLIAFSRLTPEMEEFGIQQPYYDIDDNLSTCVHGTIPNAEAIAKKYDFNIKVDTEIFTEMNFDDAIEEVNKAGGKISAIQFDGENLKTYHNGLGLFDYIISIESEVLEYTTNIKIEEPNVKLIHTYNTIPVDREVRLIALFSGGLDITCATQKALYTNAYINKVNLWYFDWGTNAASAEIEAGWKFAKKLDNKEIYPLQDQTLECSHETIKIEPMFRSILSACEMEGTRLTDKDAVGAGDAEAEAAISYVPFRNTFLMTLAAARAEQLYPNENIQFVIGANLSEGMIYLDNSETWLTHMNNLVKVGGQSTIHYSVVAPYVNRTKTAMISDAIECGFEFDTAFSCYFPKGVTGKEECGTCGSCILKKNAIERGNR